MSGRPKAAGKRPAHASTKPAGGSEQPASALKFALGHYALESPARCTRADELTLLDHSGPHGDREGCSSTRHRHGKILRA